MASTSSPNIDAYFLSDAHLGAGYFRNPRSAEKRLVAFLDSIKGTATHIFLLGDILDYWFEYKDVVPKGYIRFFGKLAELADSGIHIEWLAGNHDIWLFGYLEEELGIETFDGSRIVTLADQRFFLNHGDTVGERPLKFRFIQSFFRNRLCQKLFSGIHPRWTVSFAHRWSCRNRESHPEPQKFNPSTNPLVRFSKEYLENHPDINHFIFGHLHTAARTQIRTSHSVADVTLLGEWINLCTYAHFDGESLTLETFRTSSS